MFKSIKTKLILIVSSLVAFATVASLVATSLIVEDSQKDRAIDSTIRTEQVITALKESAAFNLENYLNIATSQPLLTALLEDENRAQLSGIAIGYQDDFNINLVNIRNRYQQPLAEIGAFSDYLTTKSFKDAFHSISKGNAFTSIVVHNKQLALISFAPVGLPTAPDGYLMIGRLWDDNFASYIKSLTKSEITFYANDEVVASTLSDKHLNQLKQLLKGKSIRSFYENSATAKIDNFFIKIKPIKDIKEAIIGYMVIQKPLVEEKIVMENIYKLLLSIGITIMIIAMILAIILANSLVKPIRQLKSNAEAIALGNLNQEIEINQRDEVGNLSQSFVIMRDAVKNQIEELNGLNKTIQHQNETLEQKVIERTSSIKDLLDNAGQGFLSFGNDYKIHPEYSKICNLFLGESIENKNALTLLFNSNAESIKNSFDLLFNGVGKMNLIEDLLPKEITIDNRILTLHYRWIQSPIAEEANKLMIILTDITLSKALEEQLAEDEALNRLILKVATDREGFMQFLNEVKVLFDNIYTQLNRPEGEIDGKGLFRYYHTLKGGTASYTLHETAAVVHNIETELETYINDQSLGSVSAKSQLIKRTKQAENYLLQALEPLQDLISEDSCAQSDKIFKVSESKIKNLEAYAVGPDKKSQDERLINLIQELKKQSIKTLLNKYKNDAQDLAQKLGKNIEVELIGQEVEIEHEPLQQLFAALVHLIRNSVDHGIEDADIRTMLGKQESGKLLIDASIESEHLKLMIKDDGAGINENRIKDIALSKNLINAQQHEKMDKQEAIRLIFQPGFSTKDTVSEVSGRGVGMDAVQTAINDLNGEIYIQTELDSGSEFHIKVPLS